MGQQRPRRGALPGAMYETLGHVLFQVPMLPERDREVIAEVESTREGLRHSVSQPQRWTGLLRRSLLASAVQGSNSIEGYVVDDQDAVAAVEEQEPLSADEQTWLEISGYRRALTYVLQLAGDADFRYESSLIRSLHFMLLSHDLTARPGRFRQGSVFVQEEKTGLTVYEGVEWERAPELVDELMDELRRGEAPPLVRAAMARLNLVMIHPFKDGNGRMARILQTLVLARDHAVSPEFSSIEEWLGRNTEAHYAVLAEVGGGAWHPERDALPWVRFCLRAHHMQAQTVEARLRETSRVLSELDDLVARAGLPARVVDGALHDASRGFRVRRSDYVARVGVEERTATRDLQSLVEAGLLVPQGERRGRLYLASACVRRIRLDARRERPPPRDPYAAAP